MTMSRLIILLVVVQTVVSCNRHESPLAVTPSPVPTPAPGPAPAPIQNLYGYVGDTAYRAVVDARVAVIGGPQDGTVLTTNTNGRFFYVGPLSDGISFRASKEGYVADTQSPRTSAPGGTPWIYFQLDSVAPPRDIAGEYTLTLVIDEACAAFPSDVRTRTYEATVTRGLQRAGRPDSQFKATLQGASFLDTGRTVLIGVAGDYAGLEIYNGEGPGIVERVAPKTFLAIGAWAGASLGPSPSTFSSALNGVIEYCELKSEMGAVYDCPAYLAVAHYQCESPNNRLILAPR